jgi:hypothetical protein
VVLVLLLSATRLAWGWEAERRLRRALNEIAARGEPVRPADIVAEHVPDAENAAAYLIRAAAAVDPNADCPSSSGTPFDPYPPYPALWFQMADASVAASPQAFVLARAARAMERSAWTPPTNASPGPSIFADVTSSSLPVHHLANTLGDAALNMHAHGDDVAALATIRDGRHLARSVRTFRGMAGPLVARNHDTIATYRLQIIASGLRIAPGEGNPPARPVAGDPTTGQLPVARPNPPVRPATRAQVRHLIAELLDETAMDADLAPALAVERALRVEAGEWAARRTRLLRPMVHLDLVRMLDAGRADSDAARQPTWPAAKAVLERTGRLNPPPATIHYYRTLPPPTGTRAEPIDFVHLLTRSDLMPNVGRALEMDMRVRFIRRSAAVSLAAQLYRADHGDWPPNLAALAPAYLPAVPTDPFAPDGGPLRYLLAKGALPGGFDRPVVYTVNLNGVDDTPDASALPSAPQFGWDRARDAHVDLARWPAPTTQAATSPATGPAATR